MSTLQPASSEPASIPALLQLADQCVKCGYCLPACPTYAKTRHEAESPRGRIALIQGWLGGRLELTPVLAAHLDRCLLCRACESVCPSRIAYGRLMDGARGQRFAARPLWQRSWQGLWLGVLANARWLQATAYLSRLYAQLTRRWHLLRWPSRTQPHPLPLFEGTSQSTLLSGTGSILPTSPQERPPQSSWLSPRLTAWYRLFVHLAHTANPIVPRSPQAADLDLFVGCTGASIQGQAIAATLTVCERLGIRARIPAEATCCGAIHRHQGLSAAADRARARCARLYTGRELVGIASACIAELRADPRLTHAQEICAYLDRLSWPETFGLAPLPSRVLVHEPCSHRHLLGGNAAVWRLLARIPGIQLLQAPEDAHCCGAAGTYLLQQPMMAQALLSDLIAHIRHLMPAIIVTTNPSCALHLMAGVREAGLDIEVCHPVELIARQLLDRAKRNEPLL